MSAVTTPALLTAADGDDSFPTVPAGERYFRHPGDAVRLAVWGTAAIALALAIQMGTSTSEGVTADLARVAARVTPSIREILLLLTQLLAAIVPTIVILGLAVRQRWRRLGVVSVSGLLGAGVWLALDWALDLSERLPDAVTPEVWVISPRFPSLTYVAGATAAVMAGKPWLSRSWRRAADIGVAALAAVIALAGTAGAPELAVAVCTGAAAGAGVLVVFGAPNRRPSPAMIAAGLRDAGLELSRLDLQRAQGGRKQLYVAETAGRVPVFVKVYGRDSRDADLLYRGYRALLLRSPNDTWPSASLKHEVEHEALMLLLASDAGVTCPGVRRLTDLADGSMVLALQFVDGAPLDTLAPDTIDDALLDATWRETDVMHRSRLAHRSLRPGNILYDGERPVVIDLGFGEESAAPRAIALDRAELLTSLAVLVGADRAVASAARAIGPDALATSLPYLQPLALSPTTRKRASKSVLKELRERVIAEADVEPIPMERLIRVKPRTLMTIAALVGAFYLVLPQLANVDESFEALDTANWGWLAVCLVTSALTYVAAAVGLSGSVPHRVPLLPTTGVQMASSFVNRVTPANVGGMALNVRYLRKAGADPADAVTGVGLNSAAGGIVHLVLLVTFFALAGRSGGEAFKIPASSNLLVAIAAILVVAGIVMATRRGRRLVSKHVVGFVKGSLASMARLARSPVRLALLFGGSVGTTLAYIAALAAAVAAFHGDITIAQVGAVYLGAATIAAAAPTPGGLGALEAVLVAGLTGVGMESGPAVAAVLAYRLVTYWLPILPGWLSFRILDRRGLI